MGDLNLPGPLVPQKSSLEKKFFGFEQGKVILDSHGRLYEAVYLGDTQLRWNNEQGITLYYLVRDSVRGKVVKDIKRIEIEEGGFEVTFSGLVGVPSVLLKPDARFFNVDVRENTESYKVLSDLLGS